MRITPHPINAKHADFTRHIPQNRKTTRPQERQRLNLKTDSTDFVCLAPLGRPRRQGNGNSRRQLHHGNNRSASRTKFTSHSHSTHQILTSDLSTITKTRHSLVHDITDLKTAPLTRSTPLHKITLKRSSRQHLPDDPTVPLAHVHVTARPALGSFTQPRQYKCKSATETLNALSAARTLLQRLNVYNLVRYSLLEASNRTVQPAQILIPTY